MTRKNIKKQAGFIVTIELLLLATILVIGLIVGMTDLRDAVLAELSDLSESIGALNQSYEVLGVENQAATAATAGSTWNDAQDNTDFATPIDTVATTGDSGQGDVQFNAATVDEATGDSIAPTLP